MTNYEIPESMTNLRKIFGGRDATTGKASADPSIVLRNTTHQIIYLCRERF